MAITAAPPTEPPTMAPTGADDDELVDVAADVMVRVSMVEVVGEGDGDEEVELDEGFEEVELEEGFEEVELDEGVEEDELGAEEDNELDVELGNPVNVVKTLLTSPE
jgi:hypothetical protein